MNAFTQKPKTDPKFLASLRRSHATSKNGTKTSGRMDGTGDLRPPSKGATHGQASRQSTCAAGATS